MTAHRHTALLVDDDPDACEALTVLIELSDYTVVATHTARDAVARLRGGLRCCVIILDWWLPDMNGADFLRLLNADPNLADIPVAVCTGDDRIRQEATALGAKYVFLKPVEPTDLVDVLDDHCPKRGSRVA